MTSISDHYAHSAARLRDQYNSVGFDQVHAGILPFLPIIGSRIADIGAGAGRDAKALADRGYAVTAVEPSAAMRRHAGLIDNRQNLRWVEDSLPDLERLRSSGERFEFILCSAVLMHVGADQLQRCFESLASLMTSCGKLAVSVRSPRENDDLELYVDHTPSEILAAGRRAGLHSIASGTAGDLLLRSDVAWSWFLFEKPA